MDKSLCRQVTKNDCSAHCCLGVKLNVVKIPEAAKNLIWDGGGRAGKPDLYHGEKGRVINI